MNVDHDFGKRKYTQRIALSPEESARLIDGHIEGLNETDKEMVLRYLDQLSMEMTEIGAPLHDALFGRAVRIFADALDLLRPELEKGAVAAEQWRRQERTGSNAH